MTRFSLFVCALGVAGAITLNNPCLDSTQPYAKQPWCNGEICTFGVSYLAHVQTSLACLNPPQLKAMFVLKGGFFDSFTSGIRQGGALEMRQWVWAIKHVPRNRKMPKWPTRRGS